MEKLEFKIINFQRENKNISFNGLQDTVEDWTFRSINGESLKTTPCEELITLHKLLLSYTYIFVT